MRLEINMTHKKEKKFIVKLLILRRSMFIISHLSRFSNNNVLSSRRYRHIKHLSSPSVVTASNKSLKYRVSIFIRIQLPASFNNFIMKF